MSKKETSSRTPECAQTSRREFLKKTSVGIAGAGLAMTGCATARSTTHRPLAAGTVLGANERIRMGVIGVGGRGTWGMVECLNHGAEMVALCDVYETRLNAAIERAAAHDNQKGKKPVGYKDYRELLDRGEIHRVAVLCPPYLCSQWEKELREKFHIDPVVITSGTISKLEKGVVTDTSIFQYMAYIQRHILVPSGSDFSRHRKLCSAYNSLSDIRKAHKVFQQGATGSTLYNLFNRTAKINIDKIGF